MGNKNIRTITEVMNLESGEEILANVFFTKPIDEIVKIRYELQLAINKSRGPLFVCYYCKEKIRIRGGYSTSLSGKNVSFHFAHLKDSTECPFKTKHAFTKAEIEIIKYNKTRESDLHIKLKAQIAECLKLNEKSKGEISEIKIEGVINNKIIKEWKKPDINAMFHNHRIAFELQLSTTWLSVITRRQEFFRNEKIFRLWIFHVFNFDDYKRNCTFNDVIFSNNQNAYIFDTETYEKSKAEKDLCIKCYYKKYHIENMTLKDSWNFSLVKISDLYFDRDKYSLYFHDSDNEKKFLENEIVHLKNKMKHENIWVNQSDLKRNKIFEIYNINKTTFIEEYKKDLKNNKECREDLVLKINEIQQINDDKKQEYLKLYKEYIKSLDEDAEILKNIISIIGHGFLKLK